MQIVVTEHTILSTGCDEDGLAFLGIEDCRITFTCPELVVAFMQVLAITEFQARGALQFEQSQAIVQVQKILSEDK